MNSNLNLTVSMLISLLLCLPCTNAKKAKVHHGPGGMSLNDSTTCVEFAKFARFNPYSVLHQRWFVFYYWDPQPRPKEIYIFTFPTANHTKHLHRLLDGNVVLPVNWKARHILMEDQNNETSLLVERSDRGEYWLYLLYRVTKGDKINPRDVRFKQTGDNRLLGFMDCEKEIVLAMSKIEEVPPKKHLQDEAARLGYRGRRGKSYLYQGHDWMPMPEDDERNYWQYEKKVKSSKEVVSSESSSEEVSPQQTDLEVEQVDSEARERQARNEYLKSNCIKVDPEPMNDDDDINSVVATESSNPHFSKKVVDIQESNERDTIQSTDEPDISANSETNGSNKELESSTKSEIESQQITDKSEKVQATNKQDSPMLNNDNKPEEPQSTKELDNLINEPVNTKPTNGLLAPQPKNKQTCNDIKSSQTCSHTENVNISNEPVIPQNLNSPVSPQSTSATLKDSQTSHGPKN